MKPLVSILIPAYNAEKWIGDTLRSALAQTWERTEIIVVDDSSRDNTFAVAGRFESKGVRVVRQPNQGASAARNEAFRLSQGEYIQWLDADDLLAPEKVARQMAARESKRTLLSGAWGRFLYRPDRAQFIPTPLWCDLQPAEWLSRKMGQNLHMQTATWLVSRELTEAAGPWDTTLSTDDDGEYFCRVLRASTGVRFVPESKVYYRASGTSSLSHMDGTDRKSQSQWRSMQSHIRYLRELEDSHRTRASCVQYLQNWMIYFYPEKASIVKEAEQLARDLGGELTPPTLSWKYAWIQSTFGWSHAKRAQTLLPKIRWSAVRFYDRSLFRLETLGQKAASS